MQNPAAPQRMPCRRLVAGVPYERPRLLLLLPHRHLCLCPHMRPRRRGAVDQLTAPGTQRRTRPPRTVHHVLPAPRPTPPLCQWISGVPHHSAATGLPGRKARLHETPRRTVAVATTARSQPVAVPEAATHNAAANAAATPPRRVANGTSASHTWLAALLTDSSQSTARGADLRSEALRLPPELGRRRVVSRRSLPDGPVPSV